MKPNLPLVIDGHNDTLLNLHLPDRGEGRSFFERTDLGHIDLPRAREGGFGGGFFACYTPNPEVDGWNEESALTTTENGYKVSSAPPLDPDYAQSFADELVTGLYRLEKDSDGSLRVVRTADELESCLREGVLAAILHFEGAENLGPDPHALENTTRRDYARSGSCGAGPTPTPTASHSRFPHLQIQGRA